MKVVKQPLFAAGSRSHEKSMLGSNNSAIKLVIPAVAERRAGIQKSLGITGFPPSQRIY